MLALALIASLVTGEIAESRTAAVDAGVPATLNGEAHAPRLTPEGSLLQLVEVGLLVGVGAALFVFDLRRAPVALRLSFTRLTLSWSF